MTAFPKVGTGKNVDPADRVSGIDFVNRVNWWFETWDVEAIQNVFLPNAVNYHFHGTHTGVEEREHFLTNDYPYLIPGVSRNATNHIVGLDEDGVVVRYHNLLVRYASPEAAASLRAGEVMDSPDDLPAIWVFAPMMDRLRRTEDGWKIMERHLGGSTTNSRLDPPTKSASEIAPYLPR